MKLGAFVLVASLFAGVAHAEDQACTCESAGDDAVETILSMDSRDGKPMKLRFEADPVTTATDKAFLCVNPATGVTRAKLWMPDMGHGSGPTRLTASDTDGCTIVERIRFSMDGGWEIQVSLEDSDVATFAFPVAED